jgi:hypothetical protein
MGEIGTPRFKGLSKLRQIYSKFADGALFNVWIFSALGAIPFALRYTDDKTWFPFNVIIGVISILLLAGHGYLLKIVKDEKLNKLEYWTLKAERYSWLLHSIRALIQAKAKTLANPNQKREELTKRSIIKSLQMLYEFYTHFSERQHPLMFRVTFFIPTAQNDALQAYYWYYNDNEDPRFINDPEYPKRLFDRNNSLALVVKTWNSKRTEVHESSNKINYQYKGQEKKIKSMIAHPVIAHNSSEVLGVICICANEDLFFKETDVKTHEEYIQEFGIRIAMEMVRHPKETCDAT